MNKAQLINAVEDFIRAYRISGTSEEVAKRFARRYNLTDEEHQIVLNELIRQEFDVKIKELSRAELRSVALYVTNLFVQRFKCRQSKETYRAGNLTAKIESINTVMKKLGVFEQYHKILEVEYKRAMNETLEEGKK